MSSLFNLATVTAAGGHRLRAGYRIDRSVRFRASATAYLNRTLGTPTSNTTWAFSCWLKRGALGERGIFAESTGFAGIYFPAGNTLRVMNNAGEVAIETTAVFRDPSAWAHLVVRSNGTNIKAYWNSVEVGSYTGTITLLNAATSHFVGRYSSAYFDGYLTEVNFIDGQALTPSSFGETNILTGVWQPKRYSGTYGTNGFYLNFSDNSAATAAAIGKDYSGNGNNWTPNNISVSAGATYDSMLDSPTQFGDGGNGRGNYAVLNPLWKGSLQTLSNGNLTSSKSSGTNISDVWGNFGITSGKWYFECSVTSLSATVYIGVGQGGGIGEALDDLAESATSYYYTSSTGDKEYGGTVETAYGNTYTSGDTIGCAVDMDTGKIWWSKNGTWQASGDPAAGVNAAFTDLLTKGSNAFFAFSSTNGASNSNTLHWNFGQRPFSYTPPSGFKALNTLNLP
jgi:hypothetical protein